MADETNKNPAGGTDGGKPAENGAKGGTSGFALPDEIKGKSAEEVGRYYADRYKDYDDLKTRASAAEPWTKIGKKPEEVQGSLSTYDKITEALRSGKVIVTDERGQILAKDRSELTAAEKKQVKAQESQSDQTSGDWLEGYDILEPTAQARRLEKHFSGRLAETVQAKEAEYGQVIQQHRAEYYNLIDNVLNLLSACQENPTLKIREVLTKASQIQGSNNPMKDAIAELLEPSRIESRATQMAAERLAEQKLKDEKAAAERRTGGTEVAGSQSPLMQVLKRGINNERVSRDDLVANIREKFGTA